MNQMQLVLGMVTMALVTYLIRVIPMLVFRKPIRSPFVQSFLYYMPYSVLSCMTIPAILLTDLPLWAGVAGLLAALISAWKGQSLVQVAIWAAGCAWVVLMLMEGLAG